MKNQTAPIQKIPTNCNCGLTGGCVKCNPFFKEIFDDIDGDSDRFNGKQDVHFMFAIVSTDNAGQTIQLFKRQKDAEEFLIKLKENGK